ncbi:MAG: recombinase RecT [Dehalococcoidia bacterium]|jgi:hypothetical protein
MPIQKDPEHSYEWLKQHETTFDSNNVCGECGSALALCWGGYYGINNDILRCVKDIKHHTVARIFELSPANTPGFTLYDAGKKRREQMEKEIGETKAIALRQYQGLTTLTKEQAKEILLTVWPKAEGAELFKAMQICSTYGLNPLMRHLYMIPFSGKLVCVMGIGANRLIASRKHSYSYIDDTPRIMTEAEEIKKYGKVDKSKIRFVTKLKDMKSGAEVSGWGEYPATENPYGTDKGNSKENMASIRSERQALDRLYPMDMPTPDIPVIDENFIDSTATVIEEPVKEPPTTEILAPPPDNAQDGQEGQGKPERDVTLIKNTTDLCKACMSDWPATFKTSKDVLKELGLTSWNDLTEKPSDCYLKIASVRK